MTARAPKGNQRATQGVDGYSDIETPRDVLTGKGSALGHEIQPTGFAVVSNVS